MIGMMTGRATGLIAFLGRGYLRLVALTSRCRFLGLERVENGRVAGEPILWAIWHNRLVGGVQGYLWAAWRNLSLGGAYPYRDQRIGVMISRSRDGELISRVVEGLGYAPLRGSTSRGGAIALRALLRHLKEGGDVVLTPDGPRGPRYEVQPGVAYLARKTGLAVIPVGIGMSRKKVFRSWDRFQLPLPFGTVHVVFGDPVRAPREASDEDVAEAVRAALVEVNEEADASLGVVSP